MGLVYLSEVGSDAYETKTNNRRASAADIIRHPLRVRFIEAKPENRSRDI